MIVLSVFFGLVFSSRALEDYFGGYQGLTEVPFDISNNTKNIHLQNNQIQQVLETDFYNLFLVELLDLRSNSLSRFPSLNSGVRTSLKILRLGIHPIGYIGPDDIASFPALTDLGLLRNDLTVMPDFGHLKALKLLSIRSNAITCIPKRILIGMSSLETLKVANNRLTSLSVPCNVVNIQLKGNQLNCEDGFLQWLASSGIVTDFVDSDRPCASPPEMTQVTWGQLQEANTSTIGN